MCCVQLEKEDELDDLPLDSQRVDALLLEIYTVTTDDKIEDVSQKIRRFAVDLEPYFIERPSEGKEIQHHTATLAAENKKKKARLR